MKKGLRKCMESAKFHMLGMIAIVLITMVICVIALGAQLLGH